MGGQKAARRDLAHLDRLQVVSMPNRKSIIPIQGPTISSTEKAAALETDLEDGEWESASIS
jgi:hypothetical protein